MKKTSLLFGLIIGILCAPFLDVAADFEYGFLQNAQVRTVLNQRFRANQEKEIQNAAFLIREIQTEKRERAAEEEKMRLEAEEEERINQRDQALEEAEKDAQYKKLVEAADSAREKSSKQVAREAWLRDQNWTMYLRLEKNKDYLSTRTGYATRERKSGYAPVKNTRKRELSGIMQFLQRQKDLKIEQEDADLPWMYRYGRD